MARCTLARRAHANGVGRADVLHANALHQPGQVTHLLGAISPSSGQPTVQLMAPRTYTPAARAASTTGAKRSMLSAMSS